MNGAKNAFAVFRDERFRLLALLILAFSLRVVGIGFGLPDLYHADEPIVVNHAMAYGTGDLHPHFFKIPPLTSYLLFIIYGAYYLMGRLTGQFGGLDDFAQLFLSDPSSFYLVGRIFLGALLGTVTVFVFYHLVRKFFSKLHAFVAAFFLAVCFLHVRDSHYIYADIPLVLILSACFIPLFKILDGGERKFYFLFGLLAGIATAFKYNGIFVLIPFTLAHFARHRLKKPPLLNLFLAFATLVLTFVALNPFAVIDARFFLNELKTQSMVETHVGLLHHLTYSLNGGLGLPLLVLALLGIILTVFRPDWKKIIFLCFVLSYYAVLCVLSQPFERYVLPLVPFLCFFGAHTLIQMKERLKLTSAFFILLAGVVILPSAVKIFLSDSVFVKKDVRTVAREWVEEQIPKGTALALDAPFFMPRLKPSSKQLEQKKEEILKSRNPNRAQAKRIDFLIEQAPRTRVPRYELYFFKENENTQEFLFSKPTISADLKALPNKEIHYALTYQVPEGEERRLDRDLTHQAKRIARFTPYQNEARQYPIEKLHLTGGPFLWKELIERERNGPMIYVYEIE